jgi:zinc transport system substrate-binding protein
MVAILKDVLGSPLMRAGIVLTTLLSSTALLLGGCGGSGTTGSGQTIVAAFYPIAYAAERIAAGADVENLTPAGSEPHDLELSPRDVERVREADVVLYFGQGFMPALEDAVRGDEDAVDLLAGERLREASEVHGHSEEPPEEESGLDPHVWLDPMRYAVLVRKAAEALGDPDAADELVRELQGLDAEFRAGLENCARRELVTSHAAFGYLADAYDLVQIPLTGLSPEVEPSARAIEELVDEVREEGATTVFFETLVSRKLAETVAREAGAETAVLNPLEGLTQDQSEEGADYFSIMRENLAALRSALECT